jgi:alpha-tubulin suppressor-like RCC1 family protein
VPIAPTITDAIAITTGDGHACMLEKSGAVSCVGVNDSGQLGSGNGTTRPTMAPVVGLSSGVVAVAAGLYHSCALKGDGTVVCWGQNDWGQLGNTTVQQSSVPMPVAGLPGPVQAISAGGQNSCAITNDGNLWCWGYVVSLGNGQTGSSGVPVQVTDLSSVIAISIGEVHACAVTQAGAVYCWGSQLEGRLGNGVDDGNKDILKPVQVTGLSSGFVSVAAGSNDSCALKSDGSVYCWGYNVYAELGDGTSTQRTTPVPVIWK